MVREPRFSMECILDKSEFEKAMEEGRLAWARELAAREGLPAFVSSLGRSCWKAGTEYAYKWLLLHGLSTSLKEEYEAVTSDRHALEEANCRLNEKLLLAIHNIEDAIAEGDCGEVSDFNLRQCLAKIKGESDEM